MTWILAIAGFILPFLFRQQSDDRYWEGAAHAAAIYSGAWFVLELIKQLKVTFLDLAATCIVGALLFFNVQGKLPAIPIQNPDPKPAPRKPLLPWREGGEKEAFIENDGVGPNGVEVITDLPKDYRKENISSKRLGCCVFRSADHAAHYQQVEELYGFPEWMVTKGIEGGGYPSKVDKLIKQICADRGVPTTAYLQHEGGEEAFLDAAMRTGRMVCVTYDGRDPRYGAKNSIAHMANLVYLDEANACILDNNYINKYLWMSRSEFLSRWKGNNGGWAFVLLASPAPQVPSN